MVTDDERREVARRLRGRQGIVGQDEDRRELTKWDDLAAIVLPPEQFRACMRFKNRENRVQAIRSVIAGRLADLIEPTDTARCIAEVKIDGEELHGYVMQAAKEVSGIDRDALLELANDMDFRARVAPYPSEGKRIAGYARRIREACGVSDND